MMTSRLMPCILLTRSSSLARPSGFNVSLLKSKNASAAKVTFSLTGAGGAAGGGGGAGGAGGGGFRAPSQSASVLRQSPAPDAVAGVQLASRQQSSLLPFFQGMPFALSQLSTVLGWVAWANTLDAVTASVAE